MRRLLVPTGQRGAATARPATYPPQPRPEETVVFISFLEASLVPPFFAFFLEVLMEYQIHLVHLSPNSVVMMAIFAHLYEMFVGVMPSVSLFRHFFVLRSAEKGKGSDKVEAAGSYNFRERDHD